MFNALLTQQLNRLGFTKLSSDPEDHCFYKPSIAEGYLSELPASFKLTSSDDEIARYMSWNGFHC